MKKLLFLFLTLAINISAIFPYPAEAHFLVTDKDIGAVLHVDPNDEPIAGSQASFFFEFKDKQNKFTSQNCDCTFSIIENGKEIFSQPLFQNNTDPNLTNASILYTFPQKDVYQVKVVGKPINPDAFQPFTLIWNFRVDQQTNTNGHQSTSAQNTNNFFSIHLIHFIGLGIFLLFFIFLVTKKFIKRNTATKGGEKKNDKKDHNNIY